LAHLLDLSLIQFHTAGKVAPWYTLHPVVREYLLNPLPADIRRDLHLRAATLYGAPFVTEARRFLTEQGQTATNEQIESLAREVDGVVGTWIHQTSDMNHAHWAMDRALAWQHHLFQAGHVYAATEIVNAVISTLNLWGQRDLAKALLRRSVDSCDDSYRALMQKNLARFLRDEGHLTEALEMCEQAYQYFASHDMKRKMASTLNEISTIYDMMGKHEQAIEKGEAVLAFMREQGTEEDLASSLHQLSIFYQRIDEYDTALAYSCEAEELARRIDYEVGISVTLHEQGMILKRLGRPQESFDRFNERLNISRRIGDESGMADSLGELGKFYLVAGMIREAIAAYHDALEIYQRQANPKMGISLRDLGFVHEVQSEYAAALEKYQQALSIFQQAGMMNEAKRLEEDIARVRGKMGH